MQAALPRSLNAAAACLAKIDARARLSPRHLVELRQIERLVPMEPALGEHFELRLDQLGPVRAAECYDDETGKGLQTGGE
jgi:hypothetical protein